MRRKQLKITLISDLCVSDGGVYNSLVDTEVCHDSYGIPYIPAKRIRGCLKECALELRQIGLDMDEKKMFGDAGNQRAEILISDAFPEHKKDLVSCIRKNSGHPFFHPMFILDHFSGIRTQTSVDYRTGTADDGSLRTMRVIRKGLSFVSDVEISGSQAEEENLETCLKVFTHMGLARTRGLGEIRAELLPGTPDRKDLDMEHALLQPEADRLDYQIELIDPVICKSLNGQEGKTLDYIEGSKILGLLVEKGSQDADLHTLFDRECFFSNAYIAVPRTKGKDGRKPEHLRCEEVPASVYGLKNNDREFRDKLFDNPLHRQEDRDRQLTQAKHCYVLFDGDGRPVFKTDVAIEERYHHRRPEDKSIGKALKVEDDTNANFYQISSIMRGQVFAGYITGEPDQIRFAYRILTSGSMFRIGYGRSSEYGRVRIKVTGTSKVQDTKLTGKRFAVRLVSPAIVYNDRAFYATDPQDLAREVQYALGWGDSHKAVMKGQFIRYTSVGGYQVTWGRKKPAVQAFDQGSVIWFEFPERRTITVPGKAFAGERIQEGYGELSVTCIDEEYDRYAGAWEEADKRDGYDCLEAGTPFVQSLCEERFAEYIDARALETAARDIIADRDMDDKSTISNMLLMCSENDQVAGVEASVKDRFADKAGVKKEKMETASRILSSVLEQTGRITQDFCAEYKVSGFDAADPGMRFLTAYLKHAKYILHNREEVTGKDEQ